MTAVLELRQATKKYGGVPAIENIDFTLIKGEIHALCGENGAGKSTITKVMAGVVTLSSGEMLIDGQKVSFHNPVEALSAGVARGKVRRRAETSRFLPPKAFSGIYRWDLPLG